MLDEARRSTDALVGSLSDVDHKVEHRMTLGSAALGAGLALVALLIERDGPVGAVAFLVLFSIAMALNLAALVVFLFAYLGFGHGFEVHAGPSPAYWRNVEAAVATRHMLLRLIRAYHRFAEFNQATMKRKSRRRALGTRLLLVSVLAYVAAIVYIAGETIG